MRSVQNFKKSFFSVFIRLDHFPQVYKQLKEWLILQLDETMRMLHIVACPIVFLLFYERGWQRGVFKVMKNDFFFSVFSYLGTFLQVFGHDTTAQNYKSVTCSWVPNCFSIVLRVRLAGRSVHNYEK